jgi:hypothetical protein
MPGKKIVVLIDRYLPIIGGAQKNVHQLNLDLQKHGYEVQVLTRKVMNELPGRRRLTGSKCGDLGLSLFEYSQKHWLCCRSRHT